jgi:hypothetical protein
MVVRNDSLSGTFIIAAALSASNSRPCASKSVWLEPVKSCDSVPIFRTVTWTST